MFFHTLAEFVATILIMLIASGLAQPPAPQPLDAPARTSPTAAQ